uniref:Uncharacterized protein n=1 Tax=Avena sativa TaxID=4498 RepID=A0ACD5Z2F5_AVESA
MLRLRSYVLTHLLSYPSASASPISSLHRLLRTAAPASPISASPAFAVEDYLVATCGLTRAQAFAASTKISHLKSPSKPDAVLSYLAGLGLSGADVAKVVVKDPRFLCISVERTMAPVVSGLTGLGLSHSEIARLVSFAGVSFRTRPMVSRLQYYLHLFGSFDNLLPLLRRNAYLLSSDLQRTAKPNIALLRECGLDACHIVKLCVRMPRLLTTKLERVRAMVACAEGLGVPRDSGMFSQALRAVAFLSEKKIAAKLERLKNTVGWSDAEVGTAVRKSPMLLRASKDRTQRLSEFLISEMGLEPAYVAHRPALLTYSLEGQIRPRYCVFKFLKENGLLHHDRDYYAAVLVTDKVFMKKYISPHDEAVPHLAEDYAAACRGEVPTIFRLT